MLKPLGQGGMGTVFIAEKVSTHQKFAVKFLKEDYLNDASYLARFEREVQAMIAIRHPHVVNVFDWWFPLQGQEGKPFVVMELMEGEGIDQFLRRQKVIPPKVAVGIMLQTLDGLTAAHRAGVIHRDLGPTNLFLCATQSGDPLVKILDFGLARPIVPEDEADSNLTRAGTLMGKPAYVAPEMFRELPLDARSDVFACGMILFRMLAGRTPYKHTQAQNLWMERYAEVTRREELPGIRNFASWVPPKLEEVVSKALRQSPAERYQSAEEMQAALLAIEGSLLEQSGLKEVDLPRLSATAGSTPDAAAQPAASQPSSPPTTSPRPAVSASTTRPPLRPRPNASNRPVIFAAAAFVASLLVAAALLYFGGVFGGGKGDGPASPAGAAAAAGTAPATPAGAAATVRITVKGVPENGVVDIAGSSRTVPPYEIAVPRGDSPLPFVAEAPGFETYRMALVPSGDQEIVLDMAPLPSFGATDAGDAGASAPDASAGPADSGARDARRPPSNNTRPPRNPPGNNTKTLPTFVEDPFARRP